MEVHTWTVHLSDSCAVTDQQAKNNVGRLCDGIGIYCIVYVDSRFQQFFWLFAFFNAVVWKQNMLMI